MSIVPDGAVSVTMTAIPGCTATPTPMESAASPGPASTVSWDGNYRGTVHIAGLGSRVRQQGGETNPQIVFRVTNNALFYAVPHQNAPNNPMPVYSAMIVPDGSFRVGLTSGTTTGRVTGKHISSKIDGSSGVYSLALDRSYRGAL
jgi:hypothetical protein